MESTNTTDNLADFKSELSKLTTFFKDYNAHEYLGLDKFESPEEFSDSDTMNKYFGFTSMIDTTKRKWIGIDVKGVYEAPESGESSDEDYCKYMETLPSVDEVWRQIYFEKQYTVTDQEYQHKRTKYLLIIQHLDSFVKAVFV